jgi:hypothetical protein
MQRPCKCLCFEYEHLPHAYAKGTMRTYTECLICDDCMRYDPMSNLEFLEWIYKKTLV